MNKINEWIQRNPIWLITLTIYIVWVVIIYLLFIGIDSLFTLENSIHTIPWIINLLSAMFLSAILPTPLYVGMEIKRRKNVWYHVELNNIVQLYNSVSRITDKKDLEYLDERITKLINNRKSSYIYNPELTKMHMIIKTRLEYTE